MVWWAQEAGEPLDQFEAARDSARQYADALLPVVADLIREGQAEALEMAADALDTRAVELWNAYKSGPPSDPRRANPHTEGESDGWEIAATYVRARAAALVQPTTSGEDDRG